MRIPSRASIVAGAALTVAIASVTVGGAAAAGLINGASIRNNTVAASKLTPSLRAAITKAEHEQLGPQGVQGVAGPQGPQGVTGSTGPMGPAGPGGNNSSEFTYRADLNGASTQVAALDGVKLLASCNALGRLTLTAVATNVAPGVLTERDGVNFQIVPRFGTVNTTGTFLLTPASSPSSRADLTVHYVSNAGQDTTIHAAAVDLADGPNGLATACVVFGTATTY